MKRIYLDQNKWIDLARANKGLPQAAAFDDTLLVLRAAVASGEVSLPLSSAHYMETQTRRSWESRRDLATTMAELSRMHAIAPPSAVIPPELDRALQSFFGRPASPRPLRPFGVGASHAFGIEIPPYRIPEQLLPRVADRWGVERNANRLLEVMLLAGPSPLDEAEMPDYKPLSHLEIGEDYARKKEALREVRRAAGWHKGERADRVATAQALSDHIDVINEALEFAGVSADAIYEGGQEALSALLEAVPTMLASSELERLRHTASEKVWERQDLMDIGALPVAGVYCDVVVTERFWVDAAQRAKLDEKLDTVFLARLDDLPPHIV